MTVFVDSSFYVALLSPNDEWHEAARQESTSLRARFVTTEFVLLEVGNSLSRQRTRRVFHAFMERLAVDPHTELLPVDRLAFRNGLRLYFERMDKEWSLTDCISMTLMDQQELKRVLAFDHHFMQAGFEVIPS